MRAPIILRSSRDPVRMSFLLAVLTADGVEADLQNFTGLYRLLVRADQAAIARAALRNLDADLTYAP
jgi:hypothetical protein